VAQPKRLNVRLLLAAICALMTATPLVFAQEPGTCPDAGGLFAAYDVVSVKPVHSVDPRVGNVRNNEPMMCEVYNCPP
jgi:hypothetical protein